VTGKIAIVRANVAKELNSDGQSSPPSTGKIITMAP
jgi:hypothetical protein